MNLDKLHTSPLLRQVGLLLRRLDLANADMVVAVSGGPDSVALLRALVACSPQCRLVVAHLNHQLRGADSDADEDFVRRLVLTLRESGATAITFASKRIAIAERAESAGANLEGIAREVRYDWLAEVASQSGCHFVATGHTADDQAETVLHRLLRGTGLKGLRGIAPCRPLASNVTLVRPLLEVSRAEVLAYLDAERQSYCHDRSNLDLTFTRNRIRHELLPLLAEHYNPGIVGVLCRLAAQAEADYRDIEADALRLLAEAERARAGSLLVFERDRLAQVPRERLRELFRLVWQREGWPLGDMGFDAWERLAAVSRGECAAVDLPGGIRARCRERVVQVGRSL